MMPSLGAGCGCWPTGTSGCSSVATRPSSASSATRPASPSGSSWRHQRRRRRPRGPERGGGRPPWSSSTCMAPLRGAACCSRAALDRRPLALDVATANGDRRHGQARPRHRHEGGREGARRHAAAWSSRELQKAAKEGGDDELAVLRRERKRRHESARAFRDAGRAELGRAEEAEAQLIEGYLPGRAVRRASCASIVADAVAEVGAISPAGHGPGHARGDGRGRGPRRRPARLARWSRRRSRMRRQIELSNEAAAALAGQRRRDPARLEGHLDCEVFLRGNLVTLDGDPTTRCRGGARWSRELAELADQGHEIGARHDPRGHRRARRSTSRPPGSSRTSSGATARRRWRRRRSTRSATSTRSADNTVTFGIGPAGTGKTFLAVALAAAALQPPRGQPHHPHPAGRRGRRAARLPARRPDGQGRSLPAPAVRRAARHARPREGHAAAWRRASSRSRRWPSCAAAPSTTASSSSTRPRTPRPEQMKMFLTRLGFDSKMVITGDITQVDLPREQQSGLIVVGDILAQVDERRLRALRRRGRRPPPARPADRRGLRRALRAPGARAAADRAEPPPGLTVEVELVGREAVAGRPRSSRLVSGGARSRGRRRRARRGGLRRRRPRSPGSTPSTAAGRADRRAVVPDRRGGAEPPARASSATSSSAPSTPRTCARRSSTARCTSSASTTRPTTARCSPSRRRSWPGDPQRLHRAGRTAQRRQVDAGQRDRRPQGGDRLRQAADHPAGDPGRGDRRGLAARARRPPRRAAAARRADRAHAAARGARAGRLRRRADGRQRRAGRRARGPLHRRAR